MNFIVTLDHYTDIKTTYFFSQEFKQIDIWSLSLVSIPRSKGCLIKVTTVVLFEAYGEIMAHHLLKIPF